MEIQVASGNRVCVFASVLIEISLGVGFPGRREHDQGSGARKAVQMRT